jgi:hypothetical protein
VRLHECALSYLSGTGDDDDGKVGEEGHEARRRGAGEDGGHTGSMRLHLRHVKSEIQTSHVSSRTGANLDSQLSRKALCHKTIARQLIIPGQRPENA